MEDGEMTLKMGRKARFNPVFFKVEPIHAKNNFQLKNEGFIV